MAFFDTLSEYFTNQAQYRSAVAMVWLTIILFSGLLVLCSYNIYKGLII